MAALVSSLRWTDGNTRASERATLARWPRGRNDRAHCGELPHPFNSLPPVSVPLQGHGAGYEHPFSLSLRPSQVTHTHMPHFPDKWVSRWTEVLWVSAAGGWSASIPQHPTAEPCPKSHTHTPGFSTLRSLRAHFNKSSFAPKWRLWCFFGTSDKWPSWPFFLPSAEGTESTDNILANCTYRN